MFPVRAGLVLVLVLVVGFVAAQKQQHRNSQLLHISTLADTLFARTRHDDTAERADLTQFFHHCLSKAKPCTSTLTHNTPTQSIFSIDILDEVIDLGVGVAWEMCGGNSSDNALTNADIRVVKRLLGEDGEWWTAEYPHTINSGVARLLFSKGFSVIMNRLNMRWQPIFRAARQLSSIFHGHRVDVNMYLTPHNAQAFETHFDWMDAFVVQIVGQKRWNLYPSVISSPRIDQKFKLAHNDLPPQPSTTLDLLASHVLFLPRGVPHEAATNSTACHKTGDGTCFSLHLTFGVEVDLEHTWEGLLHWGVETVPENVRCAVGSLVLVHKAIYVLGAGTDKLRRSVMLRDYDPETEHSEVQDIFSELWGLLDAFVHHTTTSISTLPDNIPSQLELFLDNAEIEQGNTNASIDDLRSCVRNLGGVLDANVALGALQKHFDIARKEWEEKELLCLRQHQVSYRKTEL